MLDYACLVWRSAARCHIRTFQVLESYYLRIATGALWYMNSRQIHEDFGDPFFGNHITALTESFDSKLADAGKPLVHQLGRYLTEGWPKSPEGQAKRDDGQHTGCTWNGYQIDQMNYANNLKLGAFRLPRLRFHRDFPQL